MNKIYKVIWSKVKNCYIVASELAKSHTKSPNSGIVGYASLAALESKINMDLSRGFVAGVFPMVNTPVAKLSDFKITVAAIVKNEAQNVPTWVQAARSCADEIIVVDTGSTDGTVERFRDYGIECYHYDWNDDFASAKNYMISLCHGDWIVLLDGDEWFREGCDVRKAIAKHHGNPITKAIIADWICLDKDRNNAVMFSGGAVRAFRNQPDVRYFRKVHENLTINYENFVFEPDFKMYHTGYSGSVNRSKHERNLRIMRTMFDFDNGKVEYPTDWRYIEDTYAGLGDYPKALWAADKMISYGIQEYSAAAWITKFNVLFAMKTPLAEMVKQFEYCFRTVPSVSGFRFLAAIYYFRNGQIEAGLDNYIEGLRMLMGPQDKVAQEHTYWRMYMPEASALASAVYLQNKQVEAALYACKVSEQYCGSNDWTNTALADVRCVFNQTEEGLLGNISERVLPVLQFAKKGVLATALVSSLTVGMVGVANTVFAGSCDLNGANCASGSEVSVTGGQCNTANGDYSSISGGYCNFIGPLYSFTADGVVHYVLPGDSGIFGSLYNYNGSYYPMSSYSACFATISGGACNISVGYASSIGAGNCNTASGCFSSVSGGFCNLASGYTSAVSGGGYNISCGCFSSVSGGYCNFSSCYYSSVSGGSLNRAMSSYSSVSGGYNNTASGQCSSVSGGFSNNASCFNASVSGGSCNRASGQHASVSGGNCNIASGQQSSVTGGCANVACYFYATVSGGERNIASGMSSSVTGGCCNTASGYQSTVSGGQCNTVSGTYASISGGCCNIASNYYASIFGSAYSTASGCNATVIGGYMNKATGNSSLISGGYCNTASNTYASVFGSYYGEAVGLNSTVLGGSYGKSYGRYSVSVGGGITGDASCSSIAEFSVAIGKCATTTQNYEVAIGSSCASVKIDGNLTVDGAKTVTDGTTTKTWSDLLNVSGSGGGSSAASLPNTLALGTCGTTAACASGTNALAIGEGAVASGDKAISIGTGNQVRGDNSGAFGDPNIVDANNSYTVGNNSTISENVDGAFVLGNNVFVNNGNLPDNWNSLTDAEKSDITGEGAIALGNNVSISLCNKVNSSRSSDSVGSPKIQHVVAVGDSAVVGEENGVAIGYQAEAKALNALASGTCAKALSEGATALGQGTIVHENSSFATAVGYETEATGEGASAFGDNAIAGDKFATAFGRATNAQCEASTAIGNEAVTTGKRAVAIGNESVASAEGATSIGNSSNAVTRNAVSIGNQAVANGEGVGVVAIGNCAQVGTVGSAKGSSTAVGALANVQSTYSTALGAQTSVTANNSVALGAGSVASQANVVSVGAGTATDPYPATRKIINVTAGTANTDVSTVGQTGNQLDLSGTTLQLKNANGTVLDSLTLPAGNTYTAGNGLELDTNNEFTVKAGTNVNVDGNGVNVLGNGTVTHGNTGLISGGTLYSEVRPASNGNYITTTGTTSSNLTALDTQLKTTTDSLVTEVTNRTNADTALGTRIDNAITAYESADTGLSNRIGAVASDGNYIKASSTKNVAENLGLLDTQVKANADAIDANKVHFFKVNSSDSYDNNYNGEGATGGGAIAIGQDIDASGVGGIAIGTTLDATSLGSIAIGSEVVSSAVSSIGMGDASLALSDYSIAIGSNAGTSSEATNAVAIGHFASATGVDSVAIGTHSDASEDNTVSFGTNAYGSIPEINRRLIHVATGLNDTDAVNVKQLNDSINAQKVEYVGINVVWKDWADLTDSEKTSLGVTTETEYDVLVAGSNRNGEGAIGIDSIAIGKDVKANYNDSIAIGKKISMTSGNTGDNIAIGTSVVSKGNNSVAVGSGIVSDSYSVALGNNAIITNPYSIAIGCNAVSGGIAIGTESFSSHNTSLALGYKAKVTNSGATGSVAIGDESVVNGMLSIAMGHQSVANEDATAVGSYATAPCMFSTSVGYDSKATNYAATAFGTQAVASGCSSTALGFNSLSSACFSSAFGFNSHAVGDCSVSVGFASTAACDAVALGSVAIALPSNSVALGNYSYVSEPNVVSVGHKIGDSYNNITFNDNLTRRIINVTAGVNDTDAVNVKQLNDATTKYYGVNAHFEEWIDSTAEALKTKYNVTTKAEYDDLVANGLNIHGQGAVGQNSIAIGNNSTALSKETVSLGTNALAGGTSEYGTDLEGAIAIGRNVQATNFDSIAIGGSGINGELTEASGSHSIALGHNAHATCDFSTAIGRNATSSGTYSTVVGPYSVATGSDSTVIGYDSKALANFSFVGGYCSIVANGAGYSIAIGNNAVVAGTGNSIAIGDQAKVNSGWINIAIGQDAVVATGSLATNESIAIGNHTKTNGNFTTAIGFSANAANCMSTAVGANTKTAGQYSNAVGYNSEAYGMDSSAFGTYALSNCNYSNAFGYSVQATNESALAMGHCVIANGVRSTAVGYNNNAYTQDSVVLGSGSSAGTCNASNVYSAVAIGKYVHADSNGSIGIGDSVNVTGDSSVAIGMNLTNSACNGIVLGRSASVTGNNAIGLGYCSFVTGNNSVALGSNSVANEDNVVSLGKDAVTGDYPVAEVTRRIQHVTAGVNDTDAVNVGQLRDSQSKFMSVGNESWYEGTDWDSEYNSVLRNPEQKRLFNDIYNVHTKDEYIALMNDSDRNNRNNNGATGDNSLAFGRLAIAQGISDVVIGDSAASGSRGSANIAIGQLSYAEGNGSFNTAIGYKSEAAGGTSIAIGDHAKSTSLASVTIGSCAVSSGGYSVTIGPDTLTSGHNSVTIGDESINQGNMSVAIGRGASVFKADEDDVLMGEATAVGTCSRVTASLAEAFGYCAIAACYNASAIGNSSLASGMYSNALGYYAHATAQGALAAGSSTFATGEYSTAVGPYSYANGPHSVAIATGGGSSSDGSYGAKTPYSIAMGYHATASGVNGTGDNAVGDSIAIGRESTATGLGDNLVIGLRSHANGGGSRVIGSYSTANGKDDLVFGSYSTANDLESIAVGKSINSTGAYSVAIGSCTNAINSRSIAIGRETNANSLESIAIGYGASVEDGTYSGGSIAIGHCAYAQSANSISFGTSSSALQSDSIAIGNIAQAKSKQGSVAIGHNAVVDGDFFYGVSLGDSSLVKAPFSSALGSFAKVYHASGTAVGDSANVSACYGVALGANTFVGKPYGTALGYNAQITGLQSENSIALGANSLANESNVLSLGKSAVGTQGEDGYVPELTRRIQHVTAGVNDTDAVNVKQLNDQKVEYVGLNTQWETWSDETADTIKSKYRVETQEEYNTLVAESNRNGDGALGIDSIAIGKNAFASGENAVSIGTGGGSQYGSRGDSSVSIGDHSTASANCAIAIGKFAIANKESSVAIGSTAYAYGNCSVALGYEAFTNGACSVAIGNHSEIESDAGVALGYHAHVYESSPNAIAVGNTSYASGTDAISIGSFTTTSNGSIALGANTTATATDGIAVGNHVSMSGFHNVGIGNYSNIGGACNVVLGDCAIATDLSNISIGTHAIANCQYNIVLGTDSRTDGMRNVAVGIRSRAVSQDTVALGSNSVATAGYTVSVGHTATDMDNDGNPFGSALKRRIINVADGVDSSDVATLGQLNAATASLNGTLGNAIMYDAADKNLDTMAGTSGTKLTNLKAATLSTTSTDAVIGAQLYATNQNIAGFAADINRNKQSIRDMNASISTALESVSSTSLLVDTINGLKADASLNNLSDAGRQVIATAAANAVQEYMAANGGTSSNTNATPPMAPMMISNSNTLNVTDAGNGSLHVGEGSYVNGTSSIAIGVGNQVNANNSGAFGDPSIINADESYVLGNDDTINTGATGSFLIGNDSVSDAKGGLSLGSNNKLESSATDSIVLGNNASASGKNSVALGSGSMVSSDNVVSVGNDTLRRKIVNMMDGELSSDSTEAVTGKQLYATNERVTSLEDSVSHKASVDASNIDVAKWAEKLAVGQVEDGNTGLVTGGQVYHAIDSYNNANAVATYDAANGQIRLGAGSKFDSADVVSVAKSDGSSRVLTGVATNPDDSSSAANVGYVNAVGQNIIAGVNDGFTRVNDRLNKVGAGAAAMASLVQGSVDEDVKWNVSAAVGNYRSSTAGAIGAFYKPAENITIAVKGAFGNGENMIGGGIGLALNKGDMPGVTKRQLAQKIQVMEQTHKQEMMQMNQSYQAELNQMNVNHNAEMADMKQQIAQLMETVKELKAKTNG